MVILEGCDGAGKTTLASQIQARYGLDVGSRSTTNRDDLYKVTRIDTWTAVAAELSGRQEQALVWDRLMISDLVYAPLLGRQVAFHHFEQDQFFGLLEVIQAPVIWCHPPLSSVLEAEAQGGRHEMPGVRENLERIYEGYAKLFQQLEVDWDGLNVVHYDWTDGSSAEEVFHAIDVYLAYRKSRLVWPTHLDIDNLTRI